MKPVRGMTLVELMVGLAVGMFLVAVMGSIYVGSRTTFVAQESGAHLQENGRFVIDTIANDLRMSGFRGCSSSATTNVPVDNTLNTPTALIYNYGEPIWGSHYTGTWAPALTAPVSGLGPATSGDVLVIRRPFGVGWALVGEMSTTSSNLPVTPTGAIVQGDLLMVADCAGASVLQATNAGPGTSGSIGHSFAAGGTPGVSRDALVKVYANDARVWRMQTIVYYLAPSQRRSTETALWQYTSPVYDGRPQTAELVTGVDRMAVTYGLDTNGDGAADKFATADSVSNWAQVVSARLEVLLVANQDGRSATVAQPYVFGGVTNTPTDNKLRTVMATSVSLRNALP
jgi:type IV pilus assembly protein PilW